MGVQIRRKCRLINKVSHLNFFLLTTLREWKFQLKIVKKWLSILFNFFAYDLLSKGIKLKKLKLKIVKKMAFNPFLPSVFFISFWQFQAEFLKIYQNPKFVWFCISWTKICLRRAPLYFQNVTLGWIVETIFLGTF